MVGVRFVSFFLTALVCQGVTSAVVEVNWKAEGLACCRSLKRPEAPISNLAMASRYMRAGGKEEPTASVPSTRALSILKTTSSGNVGACFCGLTTLETIVSEIASFFFETIHCLSMHETHVFTEELECVPESLDLVRREFFLLEVG